MDCRLSLALLKSTEFAFDCAVDLSVFGFGRNFPSLSFFLGGFSVVGGGGEESGRRNLPSLSFFLGGFSVIGGGGEESGRDLAAAGGGAVAGRDRAAAGGGAVGGRDRAVAGEEAGGGGEKGWFLWLLVNALHSSR